MQIDNPIRLVRELKGAPLSIVLVLQFVRQRVTQEFLERSTGYTDKPVSQALEYLREIGMADHTREGWQLCQAKQLTLGLELEGDTEEEAEDTLTPPSEGGIEGTVPAKNAGTQLRTSELSRNNSDSVIIITDSDSLELERVGNNNNNAPPSRNFSDSDNFTPDLFGQNLEALGAARVVGAKRQELARLGHVTPGYVRAWEAQLRLELGDRYRPGLLIRTIESGEPAPESRSNGHLMSCSCDECRRLRYGEE